MERKQEFKEHIDKGYTCKGDFIILGGAMLDGECLPETYVKVPLKTINRHGLIAGATGTGKTKTLQIIAEQLSEKGVPVILMDLKGDLSGLAQPGEEKEFITERHQKIGFPYEPKPMPVELMTISNSDGVKLRATVTEFGPVLISKLMELNDVQSGVVSILFKYCDDNQLPLIDLQDFKKILQYSINEGQELINSEYGAIASSTVNTIIRNIIELEQQGANQFFGEPSFDVSDLVRQDHHGNGYISIIRLLDIQNKPKLFSTFMLSLLAEIYSSFPEQGDSDVPKLAIFIDEAHLVFKEASNTLTEQIETIVKLIRSKGVGIFFCTQDPTDIPDDVLGQLGLKVQHALRAFTANDRKNIKRTAENYPISGFYNTDEILTSLGIGEALITALSEKGIPTPLAATYMRAPMTRMDILTASEIRSFVSSSKLVPKYDKTIDARTAYEILKEKIEESQKEENQVRLKEDLQKARPKKKDNGFIDQMSKNTMVRQVGRTVARELARGLLGSLGVSTTRRRR
ncbi:MAG: helicase HerA-like domain-containing protein [Bacteroidales bacterium]